jgi:hypothetical protein
MRMELLALVWSKTTYTKQASKQAKKTCRNLTRAEQTSTKSSKLVRRGARERRFKDTILAARLLLVRTRGVLDAFSSVA